MKTKQFNMRIDERTKQSLAIAAIITGYSRAEIVCVALREYISSRIVLRDKINKALDDKALQKTPEDTPENE